ncbi:MAG: carboxypeptidase regulatory-like domain-containing protein [Acidobacteriota bacterium]|nr:carboxypeptidase regulatory-like domain-containing protein [Acidobacteriota bacterium]
MKLIVRSMAVAAAALAFSLVAAGQTTGILRGTVKDPSGGVIPGARVTAIQNGTSVRRSVFSGSRGSYEFPALAVGTYTVEIEARGFKTFSQSDVSVTLGHVIVVNASLEIGIITQLITAAASPPLVETTSTELGSVMQSRDVTGLPLNARDTYELLQLQPGVESEIGADLFYGSDEPGSVSVNGGRGRSNNFMVNGAGANDLFVNLPGVQPSPDTIQEFRVLTSTFDAEFGRNSGSIVDVVTKSGSNDFHGDIYEFIRNRALNSRGFFDTARPDFKQNQFGGTLGGPVMKDRIFFFGSYEGRRIRQGISSDVVTVPTAAERRGDFSAGPAFSGVLTDANVASILSARPGCAAAAGAEGGAAFAAGAKYAALFPGNIIPSQCFDKTAADLMSQFVPLPNVGADQYQVVPMSRDRVDQFTQRIDANLSQAQRLMAYYYLADSFEFLPFSTYQASGANLPGFGGKFATRQQQATLTETWVIDPTEVNEAQFSFYREGQAQLNAPERTNLVQDSCKTVPASRCFEDPENPRLGITPGIPASLGGVPYITLGGGFTIGNNIQGQVPQAGNTFQWSDHLTKVLGAHTLKFGGEAVREQFNQLALFGTTGGFYFFGGGPNDPGFSDVVPNYLLGLPDNFVQGSPTLQYLRKTDVYLYAQDSWKIRPRVALNYGLRWELDPPFHDRYNRIETFRPGEITKVFPCQLTPDDPLASRLGTTNCSPGSPGGFVFPKGIVYPGDKGVPRNLTAVYYKAFAPRLGVAWSPGSSGKTSIRAAYGISYNPVEQLVYKQFNGAPPFGAAPFLSNILFNRPYEFQNGATAINPFPVNNNPPRFQPIDWSIFRPTFAFGQQLPHQHPEYAEQYNFTIQRQLGRDIVVQAGYVGSEGHFLNINHDLNYGLAQPCIDLNKIPGQSCGPFGADRSFYIPAGAVPAGVTLHLPYGSVPEVTGPNKTPITLVGLRPYSSPSCEPTTGVGCPADGIPVFGSIYPADNMGNSNYNSLQVSVEKRARKGLDFLAAYTFSKSFDYGSSFEDTINPIDFKKGYSLSQFDARHRLVFSYIWQLPVPRLAGWKGEMADGWSASGITTFQSGFPVRVTSNADLELQNSFAFLTAGEPDLVAPFHKLNPRGPGHLAFDPSSFAQPARLGVIGNSPRTLCCGPGINNFDFALLKHVRLTERTRLEFRAEFFNLFNHAQFVNPDGNISDGANFGSVVRARDPRLIQFALKLFF